MRYFHSAAKDSCQIYNSRNVKRVFF
uniref:Uncharacterized protein n=1 Tax=Anguilla anguilla TaxID=7936 RepID=A0A0E9PLJ9_ANGAN